MTKPKKKTKLKPAGRWRQFVQHLMDSNPRTPLKELLKKYKKKDYKIFVKRAFIIEKIKFSVTSKERMPKSQERKLYKCVRKTINGDKNFLAVKFKNLSTK